MTHISKAIKNLSEQVDTHTSKKLLEIYHLLELELMQSKYYQRIILDDGHMIVSKGINKNFIEISGSKNIQIKPRSENVIRVSLEDNNAWT